MYINPSPTGGMLHYSTQLVNNIPEEHEKALIIGNLGDKKSLYSNITIHEISWKKTELVANVLEIRKIVKSFNPDIIHFTSFHFILILLVPFFKKYRIVVTAHDVDAHQGTDNFFYKFVLDQYLKLGDLLITHGKNLKDRLVEKGFDESKIFILPHGDYSFFLNYSVEKNSSVENRDTLLFFGRILKYKGLNYLLESLKLVIQEHPDVKLIVAGKGNMDEYRDLVQSFKAENLDIHNYFIEDKDVPSYFSMADIVVLPYIEASQTGIIPIAYAFSKPVIATNVGSIPEVVDNGITGILVPPKDEKALAVAILRLLKDKQLAKELGTNAYHKMKEELSWDKIAIRTINIYKQLL
ncbi:glycosyltransferase (group 1) [Methanocella arvoryzae MRE50]|uniref:Glycosyltransferase (Group 1) n=1 Tax=Methanocella arvoryzae (strain DSM 22066 / NBRC 105507 / MRE50) TaxID=351160 RepID=Q0W4G3_METAR|nr:glycosyltransferase (group 1) [Methanocella arvoryzae MRE50]